MSQATDAAFTAASSTVGRLRRCVTLLMLLPDDLQSQIRSELAVVEFTIVSILDLTLALGEGTGAAAMEQWLWQAVPEGATVEYHPLRQYFSLRRSPKTESDARSHWADP